MYNCIVWQYHVGQSTLPFLHASQLDDDCRSNTCHHQIICTYKGVNRQGPGRTTYEKRSKSRDTRA